MVQLTVGRVPNLIAPPPLDHSCAASLVEGLGGFD